MAISSLFCGHHRQRLCSFAALLATLTIVVAASSRAQDIGRLYATKPPPGCAFIRVVTTSDSDAPKVQVNSQDLRMGEAIGASSYRAVPGNRPRSQTCQRSPAPDCC